MLIVTHPDNVERIRAILEAKLSKQQKAESNFVHCIRPMGLDLQIQGNSMIEKERPTGRYLVQNNNFGTYWDGKGKPPSWALFFGFVRPIMEPVFYEVVQPTVFAPGKWNK